MKSDAKEPSPILTEALMKGFRERFGSEPRIFCAPGRLNVIGEHTDYSGGLVMPAAINRWTLVAAAPADGRVITAASIALKAEASAIIDELQPSGSWFDYVAGIAHTLIKKGVDVPGVDLMIDSDIPIGAGVSSSAAIEIATANALLALTDRLVDKVSVVKWAREAENQYVGTPCGVMDQFASANSIANHAMLLDCSSETFEAISLPEGVSFLLVNSMVKHSLVEGQYAQRRRDCELAAKMLGVPALGVVANDVLTDVLSQLPERVAKRCRHVVTENARTRCAAKALVAGDVATVGHLMNASHASLRDDMQVSTEELDQLAEIAQGTQGVFGARMMGGGFGGCIIALVAENDVKHASGDIVQQYKAKTGRNADYYICSAVDGAHEISL